MRKIGHTENYRGHEAVYVEVYDALTINRAARWLNSHNYAYDYKNCVLYVLVTKWGKDATENALRIALSSD